MALDHAAPGLLVRLEGPHPALRSTPEHDAVLARLHVDGESLAVVPDAAGQAAQRGVVHLGLRDQHGELALDGDELLIVEEGLRAESRAVDDQRLIEGREVPRRVELPDDDPPAEEPDVAHESVEVDRRLDPDRGLRGRIGGGEGVLAGPVDDSAGAVGRGKERPGPRPPPTHGQLVHHRVGVDPRDSVVAPGEELQLRVGDVDGLSELGVPLRRAPPDLDQAGGGTEGRERHVRRRVGRQGHRVDRDVEPPALQLPGGGQAGHPASDHGGPAGLLLESHLRRHESRAPGQGHAGSPVAVVVDERLVVELLGLDDEAGAPVGAEAHRRANDALPRDVHGGEPEPRPRGPGDGPRSTRAGPEAEPQHPQPAGLE